MLIIMGKRVGKRIIPVVLGRVNGHAGGIIHNEDVLVLIKNGKRKGNGKNVIGAGGFMDIYGQSVTGGQRMIQMRRLISYQDAMRILF